MTGKMSMEWNTGGPVEVVLDNEWITMWYHPVPKIVHHQIHKAIRLAKWDTQVMFTLESRFSFLFFSRVLHSLIHRERIGSWGQ